MGVANISDAWPDFIPLSKFRNCSGYRDRNGRESSVRLKPQSSAGRSGGEGPSDRSDCWNLPIFILFFASFAVLPVSTMPGWLQPFALNQPARLVVSRGLVLLRGLLEREYSVIASFRGPMALLEVARVLQAFLCNNSRKGIPLVREGRKATGLPEFAGPPK
jgi:hypothetical protein